MRTFLTWRENYDPIQDRNCLILNFGVHHLQYPSLRFIFRIVINFVNCNFFIQTKWQEDPDYEVNISISETLRTVRLNLMMVVFCRNVRNRMWKPYNEFMSFTNPTEETIVVVGGKYLAQLDLVLDTVNTIRQEMWRVPSAVFLLTDDKFDVDLLKVNVTLRDVYSPALVRL